MVTGRTPIGNGERPAMDVAERAVREVAAHKDVWAALPLGEKAALLAAVQRRLQEHAVAWIEAGERARRISPPSPWHGEEWYEVYTVATALSAYRDTLEKLAHGRAPRPRRVWRRRDGRVVARVFPSTFFEWILFNGMTVDVWMQAGADPAALSDETAAALHEPTAQGKVALVLGAGNVNSIPALDLLYRLVVCNRVVVLKVSPVNAYLGPLFEGVFAPLIDAGFVRVVLGGDTVGAFLSGHPLIEDVHVTGHRHTYDAVIRLVDGGAEKPVTGELGGVTPLIVIPGDWSTAELRYQAEQAVTTKLYNNGFNCIATQVLVLPEQWPQRDTFMEMICALMERIPPCPFDYPGAEERRRLAVATYPMAQPLGAARQRLLIAGADPERSPDLVRCEEMFGPILAEMALPGATPYEFLRNAVTFCNDRLAGTLGANVVVHPRTAHAMGRSLEEAVADLRYGAIGVNAWCGLLFRIVQVPWGAYHDDEGRGSDSGWGMVHNTLLFDRPQKAVVRASFWPFPRSWSHGDPALMPRLPWLLTNRRRRQTAERVARFALNPGYRHLPGVLFSALRG